MKSSGPQVKILYIVPGFTASPTWESVLESLLLLMVLWGGVQLYVEELDILRGGKSHDLLEGSLQRDLIQGIRSGNWNLVLAAPPCNTFTRAVFGDHPPPQPGTV